MSKGIKVLDDTVLAQFLGTEGIEELRTKVIDMLVESIREQIHDSYEYIISPDDVAQCLMDEVMDEMKEEIREEYKASISNAVGEYISKLSIIK